MKIKTMAFDDLVKTRTAIDQEIAARASTMRAQLAGLDRASTAKGPRLVVRAARKRPVLKRAKKGPAKGIKVPPKYRDPETGVTWSGRGMRPKWVKAAHLINKASEAA